MMTNIKEVKIMLSEIEFMDKKHIVMDKPLETIIMNRQSGVYKGWNVVMVPKKFSITELSDYTYSNDDDAYEFYRERMESYGFKPFTVIAE
jgi:hypothetical protein